MTKKTPAKSNKKHTTEFKLEALKLADRVGATEAAEKLGIYPSQIYSWHTAINNKRTQGIARSMRGWLSCSLRIDGFIQHLRHL